MSNTKYHINGANEVRPCKANKRQCRFGADDHFTNYNKAINESEARLSKLYSNSNSGLTKNRPAIKKNNLAAAQRLKNRGMHVSIGDKRLFDKKAHAQSSSIDLIHDSKANEKLLNDLRNGSLSVFK